MHVFILQLLDSLMRVVAHSYIIGYFSSAVFWKDNCTLHDALTLVALKLRMTQPDGNSSIISTIILISNA